MLLFGVHSQMIGIYMVEHLPYCEGLCCTGELIASSSFRLGFSGP